jgi:glycerol kinase
VIEKFKRPARPLVAAWLAGMYAGVYPDQETFAAQWAQETQFVPQMDEAQRQVKYATWKKAVQATLNF